MRMPYVKQKGIEFKMKKTLYRIFICIFIIYLIFISILEIKSIIDLKTINVNQPGSLEIESNSGDDLSGDNQTKNNISSAIIEKSQKLPPLSSGDVASQKSTHQIKTQSGEKFSSQIYFKDSSKYNEIAGITTFRGNNYRDGAFYGTLDVKDKKLSKVWTATIGQTDNWTGVGWNGQPSIVKWNDDVKAQMNLYDEFKSKKDFVEVIYGTLDSNVHFYDLETGAQTRPSIKVPSSIKGSITVDPRGYPLLYVGQGINEVSGESVSVGYHIFSLITGKELYFINGRDKFAYIGWGAFDGNPLIDKETDTLILPGENGLIYIVKLNTNYDKLAGTISINPVTTRYRYTVNGKAGGMENSITIYKNYAYFANNNGNVQCLDLTTLTPIWNHDIIDDCDSTIGLEEENDNIMLYIGNEVDRRKQKSPSIVRKINGRTGNTLWEYTCDCMFDANVNGGVLSSPVIGKGKISNLVIYNFSKVNTLRDGKMVALNKKDGSVVWEKDMPYYSWSSPTAIYSNDGTPYIIFCNSNGQVLLIDALTGETIYTLNSGGGNFEGSPAIYNNKIIIGSRGKRIYCIEIK